MAEEGENPNEQHLLDEAAGFSAVSIMDKWANAPEFIPSHQHVEDCSCTENTCDSRSRSSSDQNDPLSDLDLQVSVFSPQDFVFRANIYQYTTHQSVNLTAAIARSAEKTCGICFEMIVEKPERERRFGILPMCNHCFCLACIRKWRSATQFSHKIVRACPSCRVKSDFVCPSLYWVETEDEKSKLIHNYKKVLSTKPCKYFRQGHGSCPFGNKCFYLHALSNGAVVDLGPPRRRRSRRGTRCFNHRDTTLVQKLQGMIFLDLLNIHDSDWFRTLELDLDQIAGVFSESDESEWSDLDYLVD